LTINYFLKYEEYAVEQYIKNFLVNIVLGFGTDTLLYILIEKINDFLVDGKIKRSSISILPIDLRKFLSKNIYYTTKTLKN